MCQWVSSQAFAKYYVVRVGVGNRVINSLFNVHAYSTATQKLIYRTWRLVEIFATFIVRLHLTYVREGISYECSDDGTHNLWIYSYTTRLHHSKDENQTENFYRNVNTLSCFWLRVKGSSMLHRNGNKIIWRDQYVNYVIMPELEIIHKIMIKTCLYVLGSNVIISKILNFDIQLLPNVTTLSIW